METCCAAKQAILCPLMFQCLFGTIITRTSSYKNKSSLIYHRRSAKKYGKKVMLIKSTKSLANSFTWFLFLFLWQETLLPDYNQGRCRHIPLLFAQWSVQKQLLEKKASEVDYYLNAILLDCNHCLFCDTILVVICVNSQIIEPRIESRENKKDTDGAVLSEWPQGLNIK